MGGRGRLEWAARFVRDYSDMWRSTAKILLSTALDTVSGANATVELDSDPDAIRRMKGAVDRDISVGGPHLGAPAIKAGLVDEFHLFVAPVVVGGSSPSLPVISTRGLS